MNNTIRAEVTESHEHRENGRWYVTANVTIGEQIGHILIDILPNGMMTVGIDGESLSEPEGWVELWQTGVEPRDFFEVFGETVEVRGIVETAIMYQKLLARRNARRAA